MKETRNFLNNILVNNITNTPMVLRQKSFKINPYKKRLESIKETRNFLNNIFKLSEMKLKMMFLYKDFFFGNILTQVT